MSGENHRGAELSAVEDFDDLDPGDDFDDFDDVDNIEELPPLGPAASDDDYDVEDIEDVDDDVDEDGGAIILEGPKITIGGDDEFEGEEQYAPTSQENSARSEAEQDARARARARAERNRLKKLASKEAAGGGPREPRSRPERNAPERQPMQREIRPRGQQEGDRRPKRDYANQDDWNHSGRRGRSDGFSFKKFAIIAGISFGTLVVLLVVGMFVYDFYDRRFGTPDEPKAETIFDDQRKRKLKFAPGVKDALRDGLDGEEEEEEERARPKPPSQQNEDLMDGISDDGIRTVFNRIDTMKRELRELNRRQNRIETALDDLEEVLQSASEPKTRKRSSKRKKKNRR